MIIGIYTDLHASKSMSILSGNEGCKYSKRLDLVVQSLKWMYDIFKSHQVDLIVNCGDTFDSDIVLPEENSAMAEALSYSYGTKEIHLLGNHEKKSKSSKFTSVSLLNNYSHIHVVSSTEVIDNLVFHPYTNDYENYEWIESVPYNSILFSHSDYLGLEYDNGRASTSGYSPEILLDKFNIIFNGHIHSPSNNLNNKLINIGSLLGTGFNNSYSKGYPGVIILDTESKKFSRIDNPYAPLFIKLKASSITELIRCGNSLDPSRNYCIRVEVPYELKEQARSYVTQLCSSHKILSSRVVTSINDSVVLTEDKEVIKGLNEYSSGREALIAYIKSVNDYEGTPEDMIEFINKYF